MKDDSWLKHEDADGADKVREAGELDEVEV